MATTASSGGVSSLKVYAQWSTSGWQMAALSDEKRMVIRGPIKLSLQLMCGSNPAIGPGKALVMEAIDRTGSISAAGRELGMSYRRIWLLVESLNEGWHGRVVETRVGGGKQGGAQLSDYGRRLLETYRAVEARMMNAAGGPDLEWLIQNRTLPD